MTLSFDRFGPMLDRTVLFAIYILLACVRRVIAFQVSKKFIRALFIPPYCRRRCFSSFSSSFFFSKKMADYLVLINKMIQQGLNDNLPFKPNFEYIGGRAHPCLHDDDWAGVAYEGAELPEARNQIQYPPVRQPTANREFLLQKSEIHLCICAQPPQ